MALDTTVGGTTANSYVSLVEADTYWDNHWSLTKATSWNGLTDPRKEAVLKAAVRVIENLKFLDDEDAYGAVTGPLDLEVVDSMFVTRQLEGQALSFPRNVDVDADLNPVIPQDLKDAQCEQAVFLLTVDESVLVNQLQGVTEEAAAASGLRIYQSYGSRGTMLAPMAFELIRRYVRAGKRLRRA